MCFPCNLLSGLLPTPSFPSLPPNTPMEHEIYLTDAMAISTGKVHPVHLKSLTKLEKATVRLGVACTHTNFHFRALLP